MASFDRKDGEFIASCTFNERLIFKRSGWSFNPKLKRWVTTNENNVLELDELAVGNARRFLDNRTAIRTAAVAASWAEDSDMSIPAPEGFTYMPFQKAGIEFASTRSRTLIADAPGLGKTIQAVGLHNLKNFGKTLIICPASLKINWAREWNLWDVHGKSIGIAKSIPKSKTEGGYTRTWTEYDFPDTDVVIINYDVLETFDGHIKKIRWDFMVCDEAHLLKNAKAIRTVHIFGGRMAARRKDGVVIKKAKRVSAIRVDTSLFLTGTPILSKPIDLWTLIQQMDPGGLGRNWNYYVHQYCDAFDDGFGLDTSGSSNLEELNHKMRSLFMVRRDKKSVLKELPDKTREVILLPKDKLTKPLKKEKTRAELALANFEVMMGLPDSSTEFRYIDVMDGLCDKITTAIEDQDNEEPNWGQAIGTLSEPEKIMFSELSDAREEVALAKVQMVAEHVVKLHQAGEPVILFAHHKSVVSSLVKRLEKAGVRTGIVTGAVHPDKRQAVVDSFQDGEIDVIIGNIAAMGVGFTLTRASIVVFAEMAWVPALLEQAEDRAWRHGQKNAVLIQYLIVDGSIESRLAQSVLEKMGVIFDALDKIYS